MGPSCTGLSMTLSHTFSSCPSNPNGNSLSEGDVSLYVRLFSGSEEGLPLRLNFPEKPTSVFLPEVESLGLSCNCFWLRLSSSSSSSPGVVSFRSSSTPVYSVSLKDLLRPRQTVPFRLMTLYPTQRENRVPKKPPTRISIPERDPQGLKWTWGVGPGPKGCPRCQGWRSLCRGSVVRHRGRLSRPGHRHPRS